MSLLQQVTDFSEELFFGRRFRRCRRCGRGFFFLAHVLHEAEELLHDDEHHDSDNEEVDDATDEASVGNGHAFGCREGESLEAFASILAAAHGDNGGNARHHDVVNEGGDDFAECTTDDHTDSHIDDVALECEGFELFDV